MTIDLFFMKSFEFGLLLIFFGIFIIICYKKYFYYLIMKSTYTSVNGFLNPKKLITNKDKKNYSNTAGNNSQKNIVKTVFNTYSNTNFKEDDTPDISQQLNYTQRRQNSNSITKPLLQNIRDLQFIKITQQNSNDSSPQKINTPLNSDYMKIDNTFSSHSKQISQFEDQLSASDTNRKYLGLGNQNIRDMNSNFQQSKNQCKEILIKLNNRILDTNKSLDKIIEEHQKKVKKLIDLQYRKLKDALQNAVQEIFRQSEAQIKQQLLQQQYKVNYNLYNHKQELEKYYLKFERMKQSLESDNWRKTTAQILTKNFELQVQNKIQIVNRDRKQFLDVNIQISREKMIRFSQSLNDLLNLRLNKGTRM